MVQNLNFRRSKSVKYNRIKMVKILSSVLWFALLMKELHSQCLEYKCLEGEESQNIKFCQKKGNGNEIESAPCSGECLQLQVGWAICVKKREA
jgi:hypothetical protein